MGAFTDAANAYLSAEDTADEFRYQLIENIKVASGEQLHQLALLLIKDASAK